MIKNIQLDGDPCTIQLSIGCSKPTKIWIKVCDARKNKTYYTKRYAKINGEQTYYVRLPQAPDMATLIVYADGDTPLAKSNKFKVFGINILPLVIKPIPISRKTKSFIAFAQEFCEEASYLNATPKGETYMSNNGKFRIDYFDKIRNRSTGKVVSTPARISQINGKIEISKDMFSKYSVPMRMAIILHEYSHFYLNVNPSSEIESDINGLRIYLSMGYPRIDAYNVFLNVFKTSANDLNLDRFEKLDNFIKSYEYSDK